MDISCRSAVRQFFHANQRPATARPLGHADLAEQTHHDDGERRPEDARRSGRRPESGRGRRGSRRGWESPLRGRFPSHGR